MLIDCALLRDGFELLENPSQIQCLENTIKMAVLLYAEHLQNAIERDLRRKILN